MRALAALPTAAGTARAGAEAGAATRRARCAAKAAAGPVMALAASGCFAVADLAGAAAGAADLCVARAAAAALLPAATAAGWLFVKLVDFVACFDPFEVAALTVAPATAGAALGLAVPALPAPAAGFTAGLFLEVVTCAAAPFTGATLRGDAFDDTADFDAFGAAPAWLVLRVGAGAGVVLAFAAILVF